MLKNLMTSMLGIFLSIELSGASYGAPPSGFVVREGHRLMLDGESRYFAGANQYYLFYKSKAMTDSVFASASAMGLNVLRTWAFCDGEWHDGHSLQPAPRVYNEESFKNLDYAILRAEELGIKLVFSLVNNWQAFGGMNAYVKWSKTASDHDDFYSDPETKAIYKDYLTYVLSRRNTLTGRLYKDEPAILMWELANEPRIAKSRVSELYQWIDEMAAFIKKIDPNHLVSTGSEGDYDTDLVLTHQSPHVDVVSFHLYPEDWGFSKEKTMSYIAKQIKIAKEELKKPIFCGEFGIRNKADRDSIYRDWYGAFKSLGIDGALFWLLSGRQDDGTLYPDYDGFTIYHPQSVATIPLIEDFGLWARQQSGKILDRQPPELTLSGWQDGDLVHGLIELNGTLVDNKFEKSVTINFGGVARQAQLGGGRWSFLWDSRTVLDGPAIIQITGTDGEGNSTQKRLHLEVDNQAYKDGLWTSFGQKEQDDGYNFIYFLSVKNQTGTKESGHFVARFYLVPEGDIKIGSHYEQSQVYVANPEVSQIKGEYGDVKYIDIDLGLRSVEPGHTLGFKGQLNQADGGMKTRNDWSSGDFKLEKAAIDRVVWFKNGRLIAGKAP